MHYRAEGSLIKHGHLFDKNLSLHPTRNTSSIHLTKTEGVPTLRFQKKRHRKVATVGGRCPKASMEDDKWGSGGNTDGTVPKIEPIWVQGRKRAT